MGDNDKRTFRKKLKGAELSAFFQYIREEPLTAEEIVFLCIGTDRSTGDALGPLVGTMLEEEGYPHVFGTLRQPLDASNMITRLKEIPPGKKVVAIDACIGQLTSVGCYQVSNQPIEPGKAVGMGLPGVGDFGVAAIVNSDGGNKYSILQSTSLYRVMEMAKEIVRAIRTALPLGEPAAEGQDSDER
ncbi:spore protease YyaC [Paenibacillus thalictri]|uniref:Spore protease YyaC n=1 Tax=Paenibacillus thalictri TaxID=2527873 RepID=A0A4Q9DUQ4_9BACL|nr:spore protease YyaC [Paenibacillus thalictri]TBL80699.1 spore protease YyaC [Paenibacillus thalictri]